MKLAHALFSAGILSCSLGLSAQQPEPKPETPAPTPTAPAQTAPAQTAPAIDPATQPDPSPPPPIPANVGPDYILGIDDAISVNVWKEPTISGSLTIRPDGKVSLPLVGDVIATGLKPMELAASIREHLKTYINEPTVTVTLTAANSRRVFFIGEVSHAGPMPLTREMTILQAISSVGGLTPYAQKNKIYILRGEGLQQKRIPFKYTVALKTGNMQGVVLMPGDTIVVP